MAIMRCVESFDQEVGHSRSGLSWRLSKGGQDKLGNGGYLREGGPVENGG
jgi:hypothetical protein